MAVKKNNLGRGLSALLGGDDSVINQPSPARDNQHLDKDVVKHLGIEKLLPGIYQPRREFDQAALEALADSVRENGILQPILVREHPKESGQYEIVAGERRWRAAQMARLHEVPVIIKVFSDQAVLEAAIIENVQREDLSPVEEAEGYRRLMDEFSHTQERLALLMGKSRSYIANTLRLLALPEKVQAMITRGELTAGHARTLITAKNPEEIANEIIAKGLSVRDAETLAKLGKSVQEKVKITKTMANMPKDRNQEIATLEKDLSSKLGMKTIIKGENQGTITFHYANLDQLDDLLARF